MADVPETESEPVVSADRDDAAGSRRRAIGTIVLVVLAVLIALLFLRCSRGTQPVATAPRGPSLTVTTIEPATSGPSLLSTAVIVPYVVGRQEDVARAAIAAAGLGASSVRLSTGQPEGQVVQQYPNGGVEVAAGSLVELTVSSGLPSGGNSVARAVAPDVLGMRLAEAKSTLRSRGWAYSVVTAPSTTTNAGLVFYQTPGAGMTYSGGHSMTIWVSSGPPPGMPYPRPEF